MPHIINGRALGARIREKIRQRIERLGIHPGLAVILVGDNPESETYVQLKRRACEQAGIAFELHRYPADARTQELTARIAELNADPDVTGILVQLPLPGQDADEVIAAIDPDKDVDGFHPRNLEALRAGEPGIASALGIAVVKLIEEAPDFDPSGKHAVIVGSKKLSRALGLLLEERGLTHEAVAPDAPDLAEKTKRADVLIVGVGHPGMITPAHIAPGAVIIDIGITKRDGRIHGDADPAVREVAHALTPVPGGVGPVTVATLLMNVLKAWQLQKGR